MWLWEVLEVKPPPIECTCVLLRCTVYVFVVVFTKGKAVVDVTVCVGVIDRCVGVYVGKLVYGFVLVEDVISIGICSVINPSSGAM